MQKKLEKLKEIYLADDIDSEDREENLKEIRDWERDLIENKNILSWQEHNITQEIMTKAKENYIELSKRLSTERDLTEQERASIYGKQDAMLWLISLSGENPKSMLEKINNDITIALSSV